MAYDFEREMFECPEPDFDDGFEPDDAFDFDDDGFEPDEDDDLTDEEKWG